MPEELAIILALLAIIGWIIYVVAQSVTQATRTAHAQFNQAIVARRDRRSQKKRALIAPYVRVLLPRELEWAEALLEEAESTFAKQRRASVWTPERPTWKRTEFQPHVHTCQSRAERILNISEIDRILSPNARPWHQQESELLKAECSYPERLSSVQRRAVQECGLPSLSLAPAVFAVDNDSVDENAVSIFFGKERADVMAYNSRREELVSRHKALVAEITTWNREEHTRSTQYHSECDRMLNDETSKLQKHVAQFEAQCSKQKTELLHTLQGFRTRSKPSVLRRVELILGSVHLPTSVPRFWQLDYDDQQQILIVEIALPNVVHDPPIKTVPQKAGSVVKPLNQTERKELVPKVHPAIMLRVAYEICRNDGSETIKLLVLNGWVDFINPQTGLDTRAYTASLIANPKQITGLNLAKIDPLSAFNALKGKSSGKLIEIIPIEPSLNLKRTDARFVNARAVLDSLGSTTNLAAMDWQDFEHLIRELFEREFAERGAEVKITQTSRDRGVDAVVFNPDPIQGGKYIIQAKRYTNTVDVSAVRDLCAVVRKEGASRGILVTTSTYGADAYEFANNEPVTLLSGAELLGLLEKHGYSFRIDLADARRLRASGSA